MARIADRLVVHVPDLAPQRVGQRGTAARGLEGLQAPEGRRKFKGFKLAHARDGRDMAVPYHDAGLDILVDQSLHREDDHVVQRRFRIQGQAADAQAQALAAIHPGRQVVAQQARQAGRQAAVGDDRHAGRRGRRALRELRGHDIVVAAQVQEVGAAVDRQLREIGVEPVIDGAYRRVGLGHQGRRQAFVGEVARHGPNPRIREPGVQIGQGLPVTVDDRQRFQALASMQQVPGDGAALHPRAEKQKFH